MTFGSSVEKKGEKEWDKEWNKTELGLASWWAWIINADLYCFTLHGITHLLLSRQSMLPDSRPCTEHKDTRFTFFPPSGERWASHLYSPLSLSVSFIIQLPARIDGEILSLYFKNIWKLNTHACTYPNNIHTCTVFSSLVSFFIQEPVGNVAGFCLILGTRGN